jgi:hypothetical protein
MTDDPEGLREVLNTRNEIPDNVELFRTDSKKVTKLMNISFPALYISSKNENDLITFNRKLMVTPINDVNELYVTRKIIEECLSLDKRFIQNEELREEANKLEAFYEKLIKFIKLNDSIISVLKSFKLLE